MVLSSSDDDDDDFYTNPAARLKRLKMQNNKSNNDKNVKLPQNTNTFSKSKESHPVPRRVSPRVSPKKANLPTSNTKSPLKRISAPATPAPVPVAVSSIINIVTTTSTTNTTNAANSTSVTVAKAPSRRYPTSSLDNNKISTPVSSPPLQPEALPSLTEIEIAPLRRVTRANSKQFFEDLAIEAMKKAREAERKTKESVAPPMAMASVEISDEDSGDVNHHEPTPIGLMKSSIVIPDDSEPSFNDSSDWMNISDSDYQFNLKVRWRSRYIERIPMKKTENFSKVFQHFASLNSIPQNQIFITRNDVPVKPEDTPQLLNIGIIDVLEAGIVDEEAAASAENEKQDEKAPAGCKIKIQFSAKQSNTYNLLPDEEFKKIFTLCAKEKNVEITKIRLLFDGDLISFSDTPNSLDLEDEACIDFKIVD